jgi:hypothetical protein
MFQCKALDTEANKENQKKKLRVGLDLRKEEVLGIT